METERKSSKFEIRPLVEFADIPKDCELNVAAMSPASKMVGHWEIRGGSVTETVRNDLVSVSVTDGRIAVSGTGDMPTLLQCALHRGCLAELEMNVVKA